MSKQLDFEVNINTITFPYASDSKRAKTITEITIPEGVTEIGGAGFPMYDKLQTIIFPSTLEKLPKGSFIGCNSLKSNHTMAVKHFSIEYSNSHILVYVKALDEYFLNHGRYYAYELFEDSILIDEGFYDKLKEFVLETQKYSANHQVIIDIIQRIDKQIEDERAIVAHKLSTRDSLKIVVDFDGTCVANEFPYKIDIGAGKVLRELVAKGHKIILYTVRDNSKLGGYLRSAIEWFMDNGIDLYGVQKCPIQRVATKSPKPNGDLFIDDRGLGIPLKIDLAISDKPFVDWQRVRELLIERGILDEEVVEYEGDMSLKGKDVCVVNHVPIYVSKLITNGND